MTPVCAPALVWLIAICMKNSLLYRRSRRARRPASRCPLLYACVHAMLRMGHVFSVTCAMHCHDSSTSQQLAGNGYNSSPIRSPSPLKFFMLPVWSALAVSFGVTSDHLWFAPMTVTQEADASYQIEPPYAQKFKEREARDIIQGALRRKLSGATYHMDNTAAWSKEIADDIKQELKEKDWSRYKFVVHVVIGEQKGEGIEVACRCFWDGKTDSYAMDCFENKSIFALATVYGVYFY